MTCADADISRAIELRRRGNFEAALRACDAILAHAPRDAAALHLRARLLLDGDEPRAALAILEALAANVQDAGLHASRARALIAAGDVGRAVAAAEHAVQLDPRSGRAQRAMAAALRAAGDGDAALAWLRRTVEEHPAHVGGIAALVEVLLVFGEGDEARARIRHLAGVDDDFVTRAGRLAVRLSTYGLHAAAALALREALALRPGDPELAHLIAANAGHDLARATDAYVEQHFDRFAETFDERLARLGYRVPEALAELVAPAIAGAGTILDAGCGTGLAGASLRPLARTLVGVDLSRRMLARAAERGVYDELHVAEITAWWTAHPRIYDAILAADLFIYFGALAAPLRAAAGALAAGGCLAASFERLHDGDHELGHHGRWAHAPAAVRAAAAEAGLQWTRCVETVLRHEAGMPVEGYLVIMRRDRL